jgi:hypothetical protein
VRPDPGERMQNRVREGSLPGTRCAYDQNALLLRNRDANDFPLRQIAPTNGSLKTGRAAATAFEGRIYLLGFGTSCALSGETLSGASARLQRPVSERPG